MKLTTLLLTTTLTAVVLFACAQTTPAPQKAIANAVHTGAEPTTFQSCKDRNVVDVQGNPDGYLFVKNLVFLLNNFDPYRSSGYNPPTGEHIDPYKSPYAADLIAAFNAAPGFFREQLCGLDGVFVNLKCQDPNNCTPDDASDNSWGYRETLGQNPQEPARRFIAISAVLWGGNPHVDNFYDFETKLLHQLFKRPYGAIWEGPQYGDPNANHSENTPAITVLAALAHEFGHVLWYDTFRPARSNDMWANDFSRFCSGTFFDDSWALVVAPAGSSQAGTAQPAYPPGPWRNFGDRSSQSHAFGDVPVSLIDYAIRQNDPIDLFNSRAYSLDGLFRTNGHWASFFAALSPDEDFIETFKFYVLINANPQVKNLPITIPSPLYPAFRADIYADYRSPGGKGVLAKKVGCFAAIYH